jgi:hypothetical protein
MKSHRTTLVLMVLFFSSLLAIWWLEKAGVPTEREWRERLNRVLPSLLDTPAAAIERVEIVRHGERLVFDRRGRDQWQMTEPLGVAAEFSVLETLIQNLIDLRKSPDSGTITADPEAYGLAPPRATVRLFRRDGAAADSEAHPPIHLAASLEVGRSINDLCYVREEGVGGIEVVDGKLFSMLDRPLVEWRQMTLLPVPTFQVARLTIRRGGLEVSAERARGGRWRLTTPVVAPANGPRIESALAAFSSIRALNADRGFPADNVTDLAPYGLDQPQAVIELVTTVDPGRPLVLHVGRVHSDEPPLVYVRRGDQDDVVLVDARFLSELPTDRTTYRSPLVADLDLSAVVKIQVQALGTDFQIERSGASWRLSSPQTHQADSFLVQSLLAQFENLQTSEFLTPEEVEAAGLDPPEIQLRLWQTHRSGTQQPGVPAGADSVTIPDAPALHLKIGRHDLVRKAVYAQLAGDELVLVLPTSLLEVLPRNRLAYRDRTVLTLDPGSVIGLTVTREGQRFRLEPDPNPARPNQWRMLSPVSAPANLSAITQLLGILSNLRAEMLVADRPPGGGDYGLDNPEIVIEWEQAPRTGVAAERSAADGANGGAGKPAGGRLSISRPIPEMRGSRYATIAGEPLVFLLNSSEIVPFQAELRDTQIWSFAPERVRRLVFRLPDQTLAFSRREGVSGPSAWSAESGTKADDVDLSRFDDLVRSLSRLQAVRFAQYEGPIPAALELNPPRIALEVVFQEPDPVKLLRIGASTPGGLVHAATGEGTSGPVFLLPAPAWEALLLPAGSSSQPSESPPSGPAATPPSSSNP